MSFKQQYTTVAFILDCVITYKQSQAYINLHKFKKKVKVNFIINYMWVKFDISILSKNTGIRCINSPRELGFGTYMLIHTSRTAFCKASHE